MYSNLKCKSAAKSFSFGLILHILAFVAIVFSFLICCLLSSCSANDDGSGSLTIAMPVASSSSRSIASSGSFQEEFVSGSMTFSVYIRDSDNDEVEKYTGITPGTTLTIDQLRAGTYNIAIRGIDDGEVRFYGATEAVVKGGTENTANIKMDFVSESNYIDIADSTGVDELSYFTAKITCKNGDSWLFNYYGVDGSIGIPSPSGSGCTYYHQMDNNFFEPGFTYTMDFTLYGQTYELLYTGTKSAKATKDGILFIVD